MRSKINCTDWNVPAGNFHAILPRFEVEFTGATRTLQFGSVTQEKQKDRRPTRRDNWHPLAWTIFGNSDPLGKPPAPISCESGLMIKSPIAGNKATLEFYGLTEFFDSLLKGYSSGYTSASACTMYSSEILTFSVPRTRFASPARASINPGVQIACSNAITPGDDPGEDFHTIQICCGILLVRTWRNAIKKQFPPHRVLMV